MNAVEAQGKPEKASAVDVNNLKFGKDSNLLNKSEEHL